ncbi:hypothetical protein ACVIGB_005213 [Bradyrhizobium sp. USDA 4341]
MADFLLTYDFDVGATDQWREFVESAEAEGLLYVFHGTSKLFRLTNTTLWGVFADSDAAVAAFDRALSAAERAVNRKIVLEKRFVCKIAIWAIRSNENKLPEPQWTRSTKFETCKAHQKNDPFFAY